MTDETTDRPQRPPSVDTLARSISDIDLPQPLLVDAARAAIAAGELDAVRSHAAQIQRSMLQRVINGTGTLLHTNLGRAPNGVQQDAGFRNLELDLATGERGSRQSHAPKLLARLCGAEAAMVVNNCASAVLLILGALAPRRGVAVSRGEMVEIGGGFRVPEVMAQSGSTLVEVGTTNRTRAADYRRVIDDPEIDVALVMQIHQSNYKITGFTEMPRRRRSPTSACRWCPTSAPVCSMPHARGCPMVHRHGSLASRRRNRPSPTALGWSRSRATSCSAGPKRESSPAMQISSRRVADTRSREHFAPGVWCSGRSKIWR